ncbi:MAG: hypothetical protein JNK48_01255 [Bryobacterales bacterium]|nr:hypothetical protein [Bryobacterales bacterium]
MQRRTFLLSLAGAPAFGQSKQERGKKIIDEAVTALGGRSFLEMKDRIEAGRAYSFYREQLSGLSHARIMTRYLTRPDPPRIDFFGLRERQSFGKDKEDYAILFTEKDGYTLTYRGARPVPPDMNERFRETTRRNIFYILRQRLGEPGMIIEHEGSEIVDNMPVHAITITDAENLTTTVYFHQSTRLPVRQQFVRRVEKTKDRFDELTRFAKYREVAGGIQWPFQITRERNGEKIYEIFAESVKINQGFDDSYFALSTGMKMLKPIN